MNSSSQCRSTVAHLDISDLGRHRIYQQSTKAIAWEIGILIRSISISILSSTINPVARHADDPAGGGGTRTTHADRVATRLPLKIQNFHISLTK